MYSKDKWTAQEINLLETRIWDNKCRLWSLRRAQANLDKIMAAEICLIQDQHLLSEALKNK